jgi:hypothetical protein
LALRHLGSNPDQDSEQWVASLFTEFAKKNKLLAAEIKQAPHELLDVVFERNTSVRRLIVKHTRQDELLQDAISKRPVQHVWDRFKPGSVVYVQWSVSRKESRPHSLLSAPPVACYQMDISKEAESWPAGAPPLRMDQRLWASPAFLEAREPRPAVFTTTVTWIVTPKTEPPTARLRDRHRIPPTATLLFVNEVTSRTPSVYWAVAGGTPWLHHVGWVLPHLGENQFSREYCDHVASVLCGFVPVRDIAELIVSFVATCLRLAS